MATFDRFDICAAYNVFSALWGGDGETAINTIRVRLSRIHYACNASGDTLAGLSENGREIYENACKRFLTTESGYVPCACCGDDCMGTLVIGPRAQVPIGTDLCGLCSDAGCEIDGECKVVCDECGREGCDGECMTPSGADDAWDDESDSPYARAERGYGDRHE